MSTFCACMISISQKTCQNTVKNCKQTTNGTSHGLLVRWEWIWNAQLGKWRRPRQAVGILNMTLGKLILEYEKANEAREIEGKTNKQRACDGDWQQPQLISLLLFKQELNWLEERHEPVFCCHSNNLAQSIMHGYPQPWPTNVQPNKQIIKLIYTNLQILDWSLINSSTFSLPTNWDFQLWMGG